MKSLFIAPICALFVVAGPCAPAFARQDLQSVDLFQFDGNSGYAPVGGVITDRHGTIFGTTSIGGNGPCTGGAGCGTVYALSPPPKGSHTWTYNILYEFQGGQDGWAPGAQLTFGPKGSIFGYPQAGSYGTVFQLLPPAVSGDPWTFQIIYIFTGGKDGNLLHVNSALIRHGNALYGIASGESDTCGQLGCGSVFRLTPPESGSGSWTEKTLYRFTGGADGGVPNSIVGLDGQKALYVSTAMGNGSVVQISPPVNGGMWTETVLTRFKGGRDGEAPSNLVLASSGVLYGLADKTPAGEVFQLTPPAGPGSGWTRTTIAKISDNGYGPVSLAPGANGTLIGATGGDLDFGVSGGIFQLTPSPAGGGGWTYSVLWNFAPPDALPVNVVTGRGGHLFGVLNGGDYYSFGSIFELH